MNLKEAVQIAQEESQNGFPVGVFQIKANCYAAIGINHPGVGILIAVYSQGRSVSNVADFFPAHPTHSSLRITPEAAQHMLEDLGGQQVRLTVTGKVQFVYGGILNPTATPHCFSLCRPPLGLEVQFLSGAVTRITLLRESNIVADIEIYVG